MSTPNKKINTKQLDSASSVMRALAHPLRMRILSFIDRNRRINVNKIYKSLKVEQSIASQHLRIMRDDDLVKAERKGKFIFYTVNYNKLAHIEKSVEKFLES